MSEAPIRHGIFAVTFAGKAQRYFAEDFGGTKEALSILNFIKSDIRRAFESSAMDANRLLSQMEKAKPDDLGSRLPMFVPLEQREYECRMAELEGGDTSLAHYEVNYDLNQFSVTSWDDGKLTRLSAPLDGMINAYRSARRFVDPVRYAVDDHALVTAVREIAEVQTIRDEPSQGQITGPVM